MFQGTFISDIIIIFISFRLTKNCEERNRNRSSNRKWTRSIEESRWSRTINRRAEPLSEPGL